jgi:lactate dehydrogenase-like 2-hydroxyacid dehydrogenase
MKHEVLLTGPLYAPIAEDLERTYIVHKLWQAADRGALLDEIGSRVTAVASSGGINGETIARLPQLKLIAHFGVGYDSVDVQAARARKIAITNTPDVLTEEVADLAMGLLIATVRRIPQGDRYVREGKWIGGAMPLTASLQGKKLGILGMGRIGRAIARRAEAFGLALCYQGPSRKPDLAWPYFADPVELARAADLLIAACPGGEATRGLVSRAVIDALGPEGVFVNISRGSVVDEDALIEALQSGRLGAAGLDVFANEPRVPDALIALDNVVMQPHVGSATHKTRRAMGQLVLDNLAAHFAGKPLHTPV